MHEGLGCENILRLDLADDDLFCEDLGRDRLEDEGCLRGAFNFRLSSLLEVGLGESFNQKKKVKILVKLNCRSNFTT